MNTSSQKVKIRPELYAQLVHKHGKETVDRVLPQAVKNADEQISSRSKSAVDTAHKLLAGAADEVHAVLPRVLEALDLAARRHLQEGEVIRALQRDVHALVLELSRDRTREGVVELPSGKVRMVIKESRGRN